MESLRAEDPASVGSHPLLGRLGEGGFGPVYLARSPRGRTVALKIARPGLADDAEVRARLRRELGAAARAGTVPYAVPLVDADLEAERPWLATEFVAAPTLEALVERHGALPEETVRALGAGLAVALGELHAAGFLHRDLKPSNVLVTADGPRLIDGGIARAVDGEQIDKAALVVGSPGFLSPELARGKDADAAGEVFSLGAVLAYAATGRPPFGTGATAALLYHVAHGKPDLAGVPEELREVLKACLSRRPGPRPAPEALPGQLQPDGWEGEFGDWLTGEVADDVAALTAELPTPDAPPAEDAPVRGDGPAPAPRPAHVVPAPAPDNGVDPSPPPRPAGTEPPTLPLGVRRDPEPAVAAAPPPVPPATPPAPNGVAAPPPGHVAPAPPPGRSRRRVLGLAAGVLGVAALGGAAAAVLLGRNDATHDSAAGGEAAPDAERELPTEEFSTPPAGVAPKALWSVPLEGRTLARSRQLLVLDDLVYVPGAPLRALNIRTGKEMWAADGLTGPYGTAGYVTSKGLLFFGGPERDGTLVGLDARTGKERWRTRLRDGFAAKAPLAADSQHLYAVADVKGASMNGGTTALCAVRLDGSEAPVWHKPQDSSAGSGTSHSAVAATGFLAYGDEDDTVTVRSADTGRQLWNTRVAAGSDTAPTPVIVDDLLLLGGLELRAHHLRTGKEVWRHHPQTGNGFRTPVVLGGIGYAFELDGALWSFDPRTGKPHYVQTELDGNPGGDEIVRRGSTLYVAAAGGDGITALNARTGKARWAFRDDGAGTDGWHLTLADTRLLARHGTTLHCLPAV